MNVHFPRTVTSKVRSYPKYFAAATVAAATVVISVSSIQLASAANKSATAATPKATSTAAAGASNLTKSARAKSVSNGPAASGSSPKYALSPNPTRASAILQFTAAAKSQIGQTTLYDPAYTSLKYPGGDVPTERGVCTDVVIRAYRAIGIDLQVLVYEDMKASFSSYPRTGLSKPDSNIDHRRVKNLSTFFTRQGSAVPITQDPADYLPGDVVMWNVSGLAHTGLVSDDLVPGTTRHFVVHNIGDGTQTEDILFEFPITGHFRYFPV